MEDRYLYKAKRIDNGEWVEGYLWIGNNFSCITPHNLGISYDEKNKRIIAFAHEIDPLTICRYTGSADENYKKIWENDITKLVLPSGEVRYFKVSFKKVVREVASHPKVELNAVCFEWNGYDLFPCVDVAGISDVAKMAVVGNIFDNPELLEGGTDE